VLVAGVLALVSSVLPWWTFRLRVNDGHQTYVGNAWRMSSRWSAAIVIAVGAVAIWAVWRAWRGRVPLPVRLVLAAAVAVAVYLTLAQWRDVEAWPPPGAVTTSRIAIASLDTRPKDPTADFLASWMQRDHLRSYHNPDLYADISWGLWVGLGTLMLVVVALLLAGPTRRPSPPPASSAGPTGPA